MSKSVTKADLVATIASETGLKKVEAERAIGSLMGAIQRALQAGDKVTLVGFGTFEVASHAARRGTNPRTGATMQIPARKAVKFRPGKSFRDSVN